MLTKAGPSDKLIAIPSVCLHIALLKLNLTDDVALLINSTSMSFGIIGWESDSS